MIRYHGLKIGKSCLNFCPFCREREGDFLSTDELNSFLNQSRLPESVRIYGGEPLLWELLPDFVANLRRRGVRRVMIKTTAAPLADFNLAFGLVSKGAHHFEGEFFSSEPSTYQLMTGNPHTLNLSLQGFSNLRRLTLESGQNPFLSFKIIVNSINLNELVKNIRFLLSFRPDRFVVSLVPPLKSVSSVINEVKEAIEIAKLNLVWLQTENIPLCLLSELSYHYGELLSLSEVSFEKPKQCLKCAASLLCAGVPFFFQNLDDFSLKPFSENEPQAGDFKFLAREMEAF